MKGRTAREALRFETAERFERGDDVSEIARELAVTRKSVNEWKRDWRVGGAGALASRGPGGATCRLNEVQLEALGEVLDEGPAAHGWAGDQRWTLAPVTRLFRVRYTPRSVFYLLLSSGTERREQIAGATRSDDQTAGELDVPCGGAWVCQPHSRPAYPCATNSSSSSVGAT